MRKTTLCFLIRGSNILLAKKKRGFGEGKWNGAGGKVERGETIREPASREAHEEIGVVISPQSLERKAILTFIFSHKPEWNQECHAFFTTEWVGEPEESEEMAPR